MKNSGKYSRPLLIFYLLLIYVLLQFGWWSYLMIKLNNEVYYLKSELNVIKGADPAEVVIKGNELEKKLHLRWAMIAGEGSVFFALLVFGVVQTRKAFKKETALTRQQKNFLLSVTHELKSPIASVRLQLETLLKRGPLNEMQKELLENALSDTERLNKLVENILMAARIENSAYTLHRENTNLSEFISEGIKQAVSSLAPAQKIVTDIEPGIFFSIDHNSFPSIMLNLFENALNYSLPGSTVTLSLKKNNSKIIFSVKDEGIGINDEEKQRIFQKFYRIGNEDTRKTKGTGLGLYIVKYLAEQHNGTIFVRNNSPKGSIFEVVFS